MLKHKLYSVVIYKYIYIYIKQNLLGLLDSSSREMELKDKRGGGVCQGVILALPRVKGKGVFHLCCYSARVC